MGEFILFWVLAGGPAGSQSGFSDAGCAAAAVKMRAAAEITVPYKTISKNDGHQIRSRAEIWCVEARPK